MKHNLDDLEIYWHDSMAKNKVSDPLANCFLDMLNITYNKKYYNSLIDINVEDNMRSKALFALLSYWSKWDKSRGPIHNYLIMLIKSAYNAILYNEKKYPSTADTIDDDMDLGIWDEAFDTIKMNGEVVAYSEKSYQEAYYLKRKADPEFAAKKRKRELERYHANKNK